MPPLSGLFVTLEGVEGAGKSTHARMLAQGLEAMGLRVMLTREPGGTPIGKAIRAVLLDPAHKEMHPTAELLLYAADRRQHVEQAIRPALARGEVVICDRYSDSTRAYQGHARGLGAELLDKVDELATGGLRPDVTLLFDLPVEVGMERNRGAGKSDRMELEAREFHERVREGFLQIATTEPQRVKLIDASLAVDEVHREAFDVLLAALKSRGYPISPQAL